MKTQTLKPDFTSMLDELEALLEKQIDLARQSSFNSLEDMAAQTNQFVGKIVNTQILHSDEFKNRRLHLQKLYENLHRIIAARKADITDDLIRVRKGRKTIGVYRNNI